MKDFLQPTEAGIKTSLSSTPLRSRKKQCPSSTTRGVGSTRRAGLASSSSGTSSGDFWIRVNPQKRESRHPPTPPTGFHNMHSPSSTARSLRSTRRSGHHINLRQHCTDPARIGNPAAPLEGSVQPAEAGILASTSGSTTGEPQQAVTKRSTMEPPEIPPESRSSVKRLSGRTSAVSPVNGPIAVGTTAIRALPGLPNYRYRHEEALPHETPGLGAGLLHTLQHRTHATVPVPPYPCHRTRATVPAVCFTLPVASTVPKCYAAKVGSLTGLTVQLLVVSTVFNGFLPRATNSNISTQPTCSSLLEGLG